MIILKRRRGDDGRIVIELDEATERHLFPDEWVRLGEAEGWLSVHPDHLVIHTATGDVLYLFERLPGYYCCHCGHRETVGNAMRDHIRRAHAGAASPDPGHPSGYRYEAWYTARLAQDRRTPSTRRSWFSLLFGG
jgi:hypothetical protein